MGWGRMLLLGNWGQQMDIEDQRRELASLRSQLRQSAKSTGADRVAELERENDELRLYLVALIRYLVSKGAVDSDEFAKVVEAIDLEDGSADGRYDGPTP